MARRNVMTALQAALAGIGGAASGYVQQEERKRKQLAEERESEAQDFARQVAMLQGRVRVRQPSAPSVPGGPPPGPSKYAPVGTFRGVEYEAMTPEAIAAEASEARLAGSKAEMEARVKSVTDILDRPEFRKSIPDNIRSAIIAGAAGVPGMPTLMQGLDYNKPRTPTPVSPDIARQRTATANRQMAQTYVEAANGDAEQAYKNYMAENPASPIPKREFTAAGYRLKSKSPYSIDIPTFGSTLFPPE